MTLLKINLNFLVRCKTDKLTYYIYIWKLDQKHPIPPARAYEVREVRRTSPRASGP